MFIPEMRKSAHLAILFGLLLLVSAGILAHRDILGVDIMEARNLITAREMIGTGHWFLPTLHGELRLAKPPLPTWLTAAAMEFGNGGMDTDLAVNRIPSVLAGLLLAASLFGLTRFWTKSTGAAAWATAFLSTSYMFVLMTWRNSWDIYCHAFMLAAIWGLAVILQSPVPRRKLAVGTGLLLGLSGLSKGPVSFYALLLPFIAAMLATGGWRGFRARARDLGLALGIGIVLSVSWSAAAWLTVPQNFAGMVSTERGAWFNRHTKPFWFYLQFPLMTGIWAIAACAALWPGHARKRVEPLLPYWRPVVWTLGSVLLLMLVPEKKDRYLLPALIPLCQLMGVYLEGLLRDPDKGGRFGRAWVAAETALFAAAALGIPVALWLLRGRFPALGGAELAEMAVAASLIAALLYRLCRTRDLTRLFMTKLAMLALGCLLVPALVQPPAGDVSVSVEEIRAITADASVIGDTSLKLQDFWLLGSLPLKAEDQSGSALKDTTCFVSRRENPQRPEALGDFAPQEHLRVCDLSGDTLHLILLHRNQKDRTGRTLP
jgi:4-amino-4-deoxy-L-arabinose transferase-like glycosyltransferase